MNETKKEKKERYCADCGFKFEESEMMERKTKSSFWGKEEKKWYCLRCASRY